MKYRSDFVTNSSSSSYLSFTIKSNMLYKIISSFKEEYEKKLKKKLDTLQDKSDYENVYSILNHLILDEKENSISMEENEYYIDEPDSLGDILNILINLIADNLDCRGYISYDMNNNIIYETDNDDIDVKLLKELTSHFDDIVKDISEAYGECSDIGWGGDDDTRYYKESYDESQLLEIYKDMAKQMGRTVEDVMDDDDAFSEYVGDKTSVHKTTFRYNFGAELMEVDYEYCLED